MLWDEGAALGSHSQGGWEPPSHHSHCTGGLEKKSKIRKKRGLFDLKLQNSSLEPSANSGNLLYSCLDLFLSFFL